MKISFLILIFTILFILISFKTDYMDCSKILKKHFIEMEEIIKSEGEAEFFYFALLKENRAEIKNFIYDYKMLEESEKLNSGWIWGKLFETVKKEYKKLVGKNFVSFKETKINVINFIKS